MTLKKILNLSAIYILLLSLAGPVSVYAQVEISSLKKLANTLGLPVYDSFSSLIFRFVEVVLQFIGGVAVLFILVAGFRYIISNGSEEQQEKAKRTATNAVIGLVLALLGFTIVSGIKKLLI